MFTRALINAAVVLGVLLGSLGLPGSGPAVPGPGPAQAAKAAGKSDSMFVKKKKKKHKKHKKHHKKHHKKKKSKKAVA